MNKSNNFQNLETFYKTIKTKILIIGGGLSGVSLANNLTTVNK